MTIRPPTLALLVSVTFPPKTRTSPAIEPLTKAFPAKTRTLPVVWPSTSTEQRKQRALWNIWIGATTRFWPKRSASGGDWATPVSDGSRSSVQRMKRRGSIRTVSSGELHLFDHQKFAHEQWQGSVCLRGLRCPKV